MRLFEYVTDSYSIRRLAFVFPEVKLNPLLEYSNLEPAVAIRRLALVFPLVKLITYSELNSGI